MDCSGWAEDRRALARLAGVETAGPGCTASQDMTAGPAAAVVRRFSLISLCAAKLVIIIWGAGTESKLQGNLAILFLHGRVIPPSSYAAHALLSTQKRSDNTWLSS